VPTASSGAAGIGASFSVQDPDGDAYTVTLDKVIDPARSSNPYLAPDSGTRFAAAVFTIRARGASLQNEDANDCASAAGSDGQSYSPGFAPISKYTNFDNGTIHAAQHQAVTGEITFQIPADVKIAKVQWTSQDGFGTTVQWDMASAGSPVTAATPSGSAFSQAVEAQIAKRIKQKTGYVVTVACPADPPRAAGSKFMCKVAGPEGAKVTVRVTNDAGGGYEYQTANSGGG